MAGKPLRILGVLALIGIVRLAIAAFYPPLDDEAYYWTWSQHLAWGYPDHPPMIAYVVRATTALVGDTAVGIRLGPTVLALGTAVFVWDLTQKIFGATAGGAAALWSQLIPVLSLGAVFAAPDAPLGFFWILTFWCLWRALHSGRRLPWLGMGLALGLALMSKLSALLLALALPAVLLTSPEHRHWLKKAEPYLAALVSFAVVCPLLVWNNQHNWILLEKSRNPSPWTLGSPGLNFLSFTGAQLGYYGPVALVLLLLALAKAVSRTRRGDARFVVTAWGSIPIIAITWLASLRGFSKPHWPAPGYLVALTPAAALWAERRDQRWWRIVVGTAVGLNILILVALHTSPLWLPSSFAGEVWGWDQVGARLEADLHATPPGQRVFFFLPSYQSAAQVEYYTRGRVPVTTLSSLDAIGLRSDPQAFAGWTAIFANDAPTLTSPLDKLCRTLERLPALEVTHNGRVVRRFLVYRCSNFRPPRG